MYDIGKHTDSQQKIYQIESGQKGWNQKEDPLSKKIIDCWVMAFFGNKLQKETLKVAAR